MCVLIKEFFLVGLNKKDNIFLYPHTFISNGGSYLGWFRLENLVLLNSLKFDGFNMVSR